MRGCWRAWVWNIFGFICFAIMSSMVWWVVASDPLVLVKAIFSVMAVWATVMALRALAMGVAVREDGIVVRELTRTTVIPWGDVDWVSMDEQTWDFASLFDVEAPIVRLKSSDDGEPDEIELNVLGYYGFTSFLGGPARRAVEGINAALMAWRSRQSFS